MGLLKAFFAGGADQIQKNWAADKLAMENRITAQTSLFTTEAQALRKERKDKTTRVKEQYDEALAMFGGDKYAGNLAQAMARLSPEKFAKAMKTYEETKAKASIGGTSTQLRDLGYIQDDKLAERVAVDPASGEYETKGTDLTASLLNKDQVANNIMGVFEGSNVATDNAEYKSLQKAFSERVGGLSTEGENQKAVAQAASNLNMSVEEFNALRDDTYKRGTAPEGINLGVIDPTIVATQRAAAADLATKAAATTRTEGLAANEEQEGTIFTVPGLLTEDEKGNLVNFSGTSKQINDYATARLRLAQTRAKETGTGVSGSDALKVDAKFDSFREIFGGENYATRTVTGELNIKTPADKRSEATLGHLVSLAIVKDLTTTLTLPEGKTIVTPQGEYPGLTGITPTYIAETITKALAAVNGDPESATKMQREIYALVNGADDKTKKLFVDTVTGLAEGRTSGAKIETLGGFTEKDIAALKLPELVPVDVDGGNSQTRTSKGVEELGYLTRQRRATVQMLLNSKQVRDALQIDSQGEILTANSDAVLNILKEIGEDTALTNENILNAYVKQKNENADSTE